jgi:hypothetical protein
VPSQVQERAAQRRQIGRSRVLPDRARRPLHRIVELPDVEARQGHEVEQFRMFRANLESLPASDLGFEMPSGAHLGNYYVVDRGAGPTSIEV